MPEVSERGGLPLAITSVVKPRAVVELIPVR